MRQCALALGELEQLYQLLSKGMEGLVAEFCLAAQH
jgi:hypothetical protein